VRALRFTGEGHSGSKVRGAQALRFKGESIQHAQVSLTCQLGATRCNMKGGHESIHINNICTSQRSHKGVAALQDRTDRQGHYILRAAWYPEQRST